MADELADTAGDAPGPAAEPAAMALALGSASRSEADIFLRKQGILIDDQRHHLREQIKHLDLGIWEKRLGVMLRAATLMVGVGVAAALGTMVWQAAQSEGLIIEPFSVPAELAARGLSGQAFSSMLLDKLTTLQAQTQSNRPAKSYTNNWGADLKVEIPETGVSLGEIRRFLREWLGHDTHITGEVWQGAKGLTITARASGNTATPVSGAESDLDALMQKAALNIYRVTQPYRYANYLDRDVYHPGFTDIAAAEAIYRGLVTDPRPVEQAYAWNGLANLAWTVQSNDEAALADYRRASAADPTYSGADFGIAFLEALSLSRPEAALAAARSYARKASTSSNRNIWMDQLLGDYQDGADEARRGLANADAVLQQRSWGNGVTIVAALHDGGGLRAWLAQMPSLPVRDARSSSAMPPEWMGLLADANLEDWRKVVASEAAVEKMLLANNAGWDLKAIFSRSLRPRLALARAKSGDIAGAEALIAPSPADCYDCLRIRGLIASEGGQWARADYWFARAVDAAPSIPFAHEDWGRSLLARGKADDAIEQFAASNRRGPHFADALEGWGEALMAKSQSHKALAKFAAAEKYAPNWGRLQLKWGETLSYAGKKDEAAKHFTRAATLDLTPTEKSELAKVNHG